MLSDVRILKVLAALYIAGVLALTMWPGLAHTDVPRWAHGVLSFFNNHGIPLTFDVLEAVANVLMFVPLGVFGVWILGDWRELIHEPGPLSRKSLSLVAIHVMLIGAAFSGLIELTQLRIPGRVSSFDDILHNTLGAVIGTLLGVATLAIHRRRRQNRPQTPTVNYVA